MPLGCRLLDHPSCPLSLQLGCLFREGSYSHAASREVAKHCRSLQIPFALRGLFRFGSLQSILTEQAHPFSL
jgi:hypothetical protein